MQLKKYYKNIKKIINIYIFKQWLKTFYAPVLKLYNTLNCSNKNIKPYFTKINKTHDHVTITHDS